MKEVRNRMTADGIMVTDANFLSSVVYSLEHDFNGAYITTIGCDMWCGVTAKNEDVSVTVQCDQVEDGIAMIWKVFAERSS